MPNVRGNPGQKWARVTPGRSTDYQQGVQNPRKSWQAATTAAADNYKSGIQKAITENRFQKGVARAGDQKWQSKAIEVGVNRFGQGVQAAESDYSAGIQPYLQTIESTQLPPRFPKGDPRNIQRVAAMADALRKKKMSL